MVPPRRAPHRILNAGSLVRTLFLFPVLLPAGLSAQEPGWNAAAASDLVERARAVRRGTSVDPEMRAYRADATGHVFFLVDRPGSPRRTLVKADQIALEVYWRAPNDTRQRIVGLRDRKVLPTNIRYHLDHLTVVQDDFGDRIRLGDGDEVEAVMHPAAPGSEAFYDFRLGDSLTIAFAGTRADVRVQEVQVRPRRPDLPGFVGSLFIDRSSAAIVRMTFTFTPASYVDPYLDYIRISLDNSLQEGKWWLPYRQEVEIRRELPQLDFLVGSVIRGRFDIGDYRFNPDFPPAFFQGPSVTTASEEERSAYAFAEPLIPPEDAEALAPTPSLQEVREQALGLMAGRYLSGLSSLRLHFSTASDLYRWNRAEGSVAGLGGTWHPNGTLTVQGHAGWSFGRDEGTATLTLFAGSVQPETGVRLAWNESRDLGPLPGAPGALNTLAGLTAGRDWLDPWFATGVEAFHTLGSATGPLRVSLRHERHESPRTTLDAERAAELRPLRAIDDGEITSAEIRARRPARGAGVDVSLGVGRFHPASDGGASTHGWLLGSLDWEGARPGGTTLLARLDGGVLAGDPPRQRLFLLGGRGTLPGHPYRSRVGDRFWLARAEASHPLLAPWLSLHGLAAAGWAGLARERPPLLADWRVSGDGNVLVSVGGGVGLAWDVIHLDLARGLAGGEWELVISVDRRFRDWL